MVIDVIRSHLSARQSTQQEIFFIGSAIGSNEANRRSTVGLTLFLEARRYLAHGLFPAHRLQFAIPTHQRLSQAIWMADKIKAEAPFHAQKLLVDPRKV